MERRVRRPASSATAPLVRSQSLNSKLSAYTSASADSYSPTEDAAFLRLEEDYAELRRAYENATGDMASLEAVLAERLFAEERCAAVDAKVERQQAILSELYDILTKGKALRARADTNDTAAAAVGKNGKGGGAAAKKAPEGKVPVSVDAVRDAAQKLQLRAEELAAREAQLRLALTDVEKQLAAEKQRSKKSAAAAGGAGDSFMQAPATVQMAEDMRRERETLEAALAESAADMKKLQEELDAAAKEARQLKRTAADREAEVAELHKLLAAKDAELAARAEVIAQQERQLQGEADADAGGGRASAGGAVSNSSGPGAAVTTRHTCYLSGDMYAALWAAAPARFTDLLTRAAARAARVAESAIQELAIGPSADGGVAAEMSIVHCATEEVIDGLLMRCSFAELQRAAQAVAAQAEERTVAETLYDQLREAVAAEKEQRAAARRWEAAARAAEASLERAARERSTADADVEATLSETAATVEELAAAVTQLQGELTEARASLAEMEREREEAAKTLEFTRRSLNAKRALLRAAEEKVEQLQARSSSNTAGTADDAEVQARLAEQQETIEALQAELLAAHKTKPAAADGAQTMVRDRFDVTVRVSPPELLTCVAAKVEAKEEPLTTSLVSALLSELALAGGVVLHRAPAFAVHAADGTLTLTGAELGFAAASGSAADRRAARAAVQKKLDRHGFPVAHQLLRAAAAREEADEKVRQTAERQQAQLTRERDGLRREVERAARAQERQERTSAEVGRAAGESAEELHRALAAERAEKKQLVRQLGEMETDMNDFTKMQCTLRAELEEAQKELRAKNHDIDNLTRRVRHMEDREEQLRQRLSSASDSATRRQRDSGAAAPADSTPSPAPAARSTTTAAADRATPTPTRVTGTPAAATRAFTRQVSARALDEAPRLTPLRRTHSSTNTPVQQRQAAEGFSRTASETLTSTPPVAPAAAAAAPAATTALRRRTGSQKAVRRPRADDKAPAAAEGSSSSNGKASAASGSNSGAGAPSTTAARRKASPAAAATTTAKFQRSATGTGSASGVATGHGASFVRSASGYTRTNSGGPSTRNP